MAKVLASAVLGLGMVAVPIFGTFAQDPGLEVVAEFGAENPPGNIAVTPDGRIIMSQHPFYGPDWRVVEVMPDGSVAPFPNEAWAGPMDANGIGLVGPLGLRSDPQGVIWMLDRTPAEGQAGRIVAWDTESDSLHRIIYLAPPVIRPDSFLNDLAVDPVNNAVYITDTAGDHSALLVVDLTTGLARRVLDGHETMRPEDIDMVIDGRTVTLGGAPARVGANPITVDPTYSWVYYAPMNGTSLYRLPARDLADPSLTDEDLATRVERYGDKPISDGITVDGGGNVYITAITDNAVGATLPAGGYETLHQDDTLLSWADGMAFGPDNHVYVTVNQLHRSPPLNDGEDASVPPYYIVRFPALTSGTPGR